MASLAAGLRKVVAANHVITLAKAKTENGLAEAVGAAEDVASGLVKTAGSAMSPTFEDFAKTWTSGELHRGFAGFVRDKGPPTR
jgi:hypothetical protein